ncbi:substrate-binding domain-containing protein [Mesorhizobium sp. M1423]|uniref:substrate-binding domain-containing protein n=1 Tax=Mesorhizobium sp. M1423 TaxID=2957101 RepID=UPI0033358CA6
MSAIFLHATNRSIIANMFHDSPAHKTLAAPNELSLKKTMTMNRATSTLARSPKFSRRSFLKSVGAVGAAGLGSPLYVKNALSSSGELNLLMWADEFPDPVIPNFEKLTGIKVNPSLFSQDEEQFYKLQAAESAAYDLCQPARNRSIQFKDMDVLAPYDLSKLKNISAIVPSMLRGSEDFWTWDGSLHHLPHCWRSEAISFRTDLLRGRQQGLSYGTLWDEEVRGHTQGRVHSLLLGIGLWWDQSGKMPSNRMLDGYVDETGFRAVWDPILEFAIAHKGWIRQFWNSSEETKAGLMANDVWIGQTWEGPSVTLKDAGEPVGFVSPKEGALVWLDGLSLTKTAQNIDQAYEFINYLMTPEVAAQIADGSGYNPVVLGAENHTSEKFRKNFLEAYPGDSINNVWHWPPEQDWYREIRSQYVEQFRSA